MTQRSESQTSQRIEAQLVAEEVRIDTLPRHFGRHMMTVEDKIYNLMRQLAPEYDGAYWHFYDLSNGGFYMAPTHEKLALSVPENFFNGTMSGDAAGLTVCLYAFSLLSFRYPDDVFAEHFHRLRDFALNHSEAALIFAAID